MNHGNWKRVVAVVAATAFLTAGCASLETVSLAHPDVKPGESVVVKKKDGSTQKFRVTQVADDALVGEHVRVAYADMNSLGVERQDGKAGHTALIVGAVVLGAAAIAAAAGGGGHGGGGY